MAADKLHSSRGFPTIAARTQEQQVGDMAKCDPVQHWLDSAKADLRVARTVFKGGHWRFTVFVCHLTVEKSIKAAVQKKTGMLPPKIHDLGALLIKSGCQLPPDLEKFVRKLAGLSIPTRYPDDLDAVKVQYTGASANLYLQMTSKVYRWFSRAVRSLE